MVQMILELPKLPMQINQLPRKVSLVSCQENSKSLVVVESIARLLVRVL